MPEEYGPASRAAALNRQLSRVKSRLTSLKSADPRTSRRLEDTKQRLEQVCVRLENDTASVLAQVGDRLSVTNQWGLWNGISQRFRALTADCLALEQSAGLRADKYVASLCEVAENLAEGFSDAVLRPRPHFVLISEAEHFGADASAIHLGYGRLDFWSLNRVTHEFGHLCAGDFANGISRAQDNFVRLLTKKRKNNDTADAQSGGAQNPVSVCNESEAREFFADIMAAFLTGPAYAASCLTLDFNPADDRRTNSHPTGHERAHCILIALGRLTPKYHPFSQEELKRLIARLCREWSQARESANMRTTIENRIELEYAVEILVDTLVREIPGAQCRSLSNAHAVKNALSKGNRLPSQAGAVDVLNGAWLSRWTDGDDGTPAIAKGALEMLLECCHE